MGVDDRLHSGSLRFKKTHVCGQAGWTNFAHKVSDVCQLRRAIAPSAFSRAGFYTRKESLAISPFQWSSRPTRFRVVLEL